MPDTTTTPAVPVRTLVLAGLAVLGLLLALAAAFLVGGASAAEPMSGSTAATGSTTRTAAGDVPGTLAMSGHGESVGVPDQLTFTVAVTRTAPDVATAMDDASRTTGRVLAALEREGVLRKDVQSTGLSVDPVYRYSTYDPPVLTGYRVGQRASVLARDLADGGRAVAAATRAGGNAVRVSGIGLRIGEKDALLGRARDAAVAEATAKAEQYAAATGQRLGRVLTLTEGKQALRATRDQVVGGVAERAADAVSLKALPVRAGRQDLGVDVAIVWQLLPAE